MAPSATTTAQAETQPTAVVKSSQPASSHLLNQEPEEMECQLPSLSRGPNPLTGNHYPNLTDQL